MSGDGLYLSHGRNLRRIIRRLGYPSHEALARWIEHDLALPFQVLPASDPRPNRRPHTWESGVHCATSCYEVYALCTHSFFNEKPNA